MYSIEIDRNKTLIIISAAGHVSAEEVKSAAAQLLEILRDVAPGFRLLSDFRWLESMETGAAAHIAGIMDAVAEKQVALVVRVVPDPHKDIGLNILSQFHYGSEVPILTFETLAEAVASLADGERR
jgi:hypothetical protein